MCDVDSRVECICVKSAMKYLTSQNLSVCLSMRILATRDVNVKKVGKVLIVNTKLAKLLTIRDHQTHSESPLG